MPHGQGVLTDKYASKFIGEFNNGDITFGKIKHIDGFVYEGGIMNFKMHGKGVTKYPNGNQFEGDFQDNFQHGYIK